MNQKYIKLCEYITKLGCDKKSILDNKIKINHCMADSKNSVLISPEGKLGRCEHHFEDDFYGSVITDTPKEPWSEYYNYFEKCKNCAVFPVCFRLKNCPNITEECNEFLQMNKIFEIKRSMLHTADKILKSQNLKTI